MPDGFHSATSQIQAKPVFQLETDYTQVDNFRNVLGFALKTLGEHPISHKQLENIADNAVILAKQLLEDNVYSTSISELPHTRTLINSVQSRTVGNKVHIFSDARGRNGYPYAGSIEYGFHPWGRNHFVPPRPFLRPAIEFAANATRSEFYNNLSTMIYSMETNTFALSHFGNTSNQLGVSRRIWGLNVGQRGMGHAYVMNDAARDGRIMGKYSYSHQYNRYGVRKASYGEKWRISGRKR